MRIDRLLSIVTYLLNRDVVTGKTLAEKYEVTERTIQRDIESINAAGIPIVSLRGMNGGYQIMDHYRFSKQTTTQADMEAIRLALTSLETVIDSEKVSGTLEKINSLSRGESSKLSLDFSVAKENRKVQEYIARIEDAIEKRLIIEFSYVNSKNQESSKSVEPVCLQFKWYAWYLVAYSHGLKDYRIYKLVRMNNLSICQKGFIIDHDFEKNHFDNLISMDNREPTRLELKCKSSSYASFLEYFHTTKLLSVDATDHLLEVYVIEEERLWFAFILSFGDEIKVLSPKHIRHRIYDHAKKIMDNLNKPDR